MTRRVVIVGAGQAGARAAQTLRSSGFEGEITLVGDEPHAPYERPSLSKEMLLDRSTETIAWIHDEDFYRAQGITLRLGEKATAIDRRARHVTLAGGSALPYDVLLLATGARARRLTLPTGGTFCHYLRSLADSRTLRARLVPDLDVVIVGAGFIGLEVAAAASVTGCRVTVLDIESAPLGRVAPLELRRHFEALHRERGVIFRFDTEVRDVVRSGERLSVVAGGDGIPADLVVAGVGATPNSELAREAGLNCDRGIMVDEFGRTSDPSIFAAGDVAQHFNPLFGRTILLESWQNAQNQAIAVARNIAQPADPQPYAEIPWFWSDQFGHNLQIFGVLDPEAEQVIRGDPSQSSWILLQIRDRRIVYGAGINVARELRPVRDLIRLGLPVDPDRLAHPDVSLAELLREARTANRSSEGGDRADAVAPG